MPSPFDPHLNDRQRAFVLIALLVDHSQAATLVPYLHPQEGRLISSAIQNLSSQEKLKKRQIVLDELKRLDLEAKRSVLGEIHPDWLAQILEKESPRLVATVLRHLPGGQVRALLDRLPEAMVRRLPSLSDTCSINEELTCMIRDRLESLFPRPEVVRTSTLTFEVLPWLPTLKLRRLFRVVGLRELALAFSGLKEKTVRTLIARLSTEDTALLEQFLVEATQMEAERLKKAQAHLLSLKGNQKIAGQLVLEAGFFLYAKAVLPMHLKGTQFIQYKLSMEEGKRFAQYVEENRALNSEQTVIPYQDEIVAVFARMG